MGLRMNVSVDEPFPDGTVCRVRWCCGEVGAITTKELSQELAVSDRQTFEAFQNDRGLEEKGTRQSIIASKLPG